MIDHTGVSVSDYEKGKEFYRKALAPLGYEITMDIPEYKACGFGEGGKRDFWISQPDGAISSNHIGFVAKDEEAVAAFYRAALAAGGTDNGAPGPRPDYGPGYYAAFVLDADGNNVEAVMRDHKG